MPRTFASSDALAARLRPWHAALRTLGAPLDDVDNFRPLAIESAPYTLWVDDKYLVAASLPRRTKIANVRIYEAVILLDLLGRIDARAWIRTVLELWPTLDVQTWIDDRIYMADPSAATFRVGIVATGIADANGVERLARVCNVTKTDVVSFEFLAVYSSMKALLTTSQGEVASRHVPVRLVLDLFETPPAEISKTLVRVREYAQTSKANATAENAKNKAMVQIDVIDLDLYEYIIFSHEDLVVWRDIAMLGVRINHFPDLEMDVSDESWRLVVETAQLLMNVSGSSAKDQRVRGVETLRVTNKYSTRYFPGILAAAQVSPSIRVVDIDVVADEDEDELSDEEDMDNDELDTVQLYWKAMAYTLFSRHARHQIHTLRLRLTDLLPVHVEMVQAIVSAPDPLAQLYGENDKGEPGRQLTASRFHLIHPDTDIFTYAYDRDDQPQVPDTKHQLVHTTKQSMTVRVIHPPENVDDSYWAVMIPGRGCGWVHRNDISTVIESALPTDDDRTAIPSFECIEITVMTDDSKDAAIGLLETIGRDTKCINLLEYDTANPEDLLDDWVRQALVTCPRLEEFITGVATIRSLDVFVDAANARSVRLQRLVVGSVGCERLEVFYEALGDNNNALTVHLKSLLVYFEVDNEEEVDRAIAASLRMLKTNRRLYCCVLGLRLGPRFAHLEPKVRVAFDSVINEKVPIRAAALDLQCKLAFLSVVDNCPSNSAIGHFDTGVLGTVFEFAALSRTRRVDCQFVTLV